MNRRILISVTVPAVVIGLLLFGTCLANAWYVNRLQTNLARILSQNVTSQQAAQELEIRVRQLRFHSFLYLMNPTIARQEPIENDHKNFEAALQRAKQFASTDEEQHCVQQIEAGYRQYHHEIKELMTAAAQGKSRTDLANLADAHPVRHVVEPSQELLRVNKETMEQTALESQRVAGEAHAMMILLGLVGPASGLIIGYGMARGLSRMLFERQQQHEREMLRAEQLAAVGQLAASVAHEVRNPLTSVKMLVELATRPRDSKPLTPSDLQVIHREVTRLERTVQGFLNFARLPSPKRSACDLREVLHEALALVQARAGQQKVEIAIYNPQEPVSALVDREQLRTVLVNLCLNALDAMPHGGRLEIYLEQKEREISLAVADTGSGIAPEMMDRLFTPFASTKATGTGLGLSISRRIVEEHDGQLLASNRSTGGACFTIVLPVEQKTKHENTKVRKHEKDKETE